MIRKIKNFWHSCEAIFWILYYHYPASKLKVIGVTGTDGKTTTVNLIYHLLSSSGYKCAMISTISAKIGNQEISVGPHVTTPSSRQIQKFLRQAVKQGVKYVILEVTSHGIDQHRLEGCNFDTSVITNVSKEHLDYHRTFDQYLKTKSKIFNKCNHAVLNKDDQSYDYLRSVIREKITMAVSYGISKQADVTPVSFPFKTRLLGTFNQYNCLAAIAVARIFEIRDEQIKRAIDSFSPPRGRLEEIKAGQDFQVFVDFAHTPAAFQQVIPTLRKMTRGRIIHVFGCTGQRDKEKRPLMGEISGKLSDQIVLTSEDSYHEDPEAIINQIEKGIRKTGKGLGSGYWKITDRKEALEKAMMMAKKGDLVLVTGVGHQASLNIKGKEVSWSDSEIIRKIIEKNIREKGKTGKRC